jgi:hypothetical protein
MANGKHHFAFFAAPRSKAKRLHNVFVFQVRIIREKRVDAMSDCGESPTFPVLRALFENVL